MFQVYKSSAGSGKTTTLVRDYLRICLPDPGRFSAIAGITFTKKATVEMKTRIIETLQMIAVAEGRVEEPFESLLQELSAQVSRQQLRENALRLLRLILHHYDSFAFTTIDSFVVRVVKTFAFDLQLPLNFDVELDADLIKSRAVAAMLDSVKQGDELTRQLIAFLEQGLEEDKEISLQDRLEKFSSVLFNDSFFDFVEYAGRHSDNLKEVKRQIDSRYAVLRNEVNALLEQGWMLIEKNNINPQSFFSGNKGAGRYFEKFGKEKQVVVMPNNTILSMPERLASGLSWAKGSAPEEDKAAINRIKQELSKIIEQLPGKIRALRSIKAVNAILPMVGMVAFLKEEIKSYYDESGAISLSEASRAVARVVSQEPMPFIYERLGARFDHFMIDEFQDTSNLQWKNLIPLVENSLSEGHFNLIVGDAKQSIYRWRGGNYEQFVNLPSLPGSKDSSWMIEREKIFRQHFKEEKLDTNYRSARAIVNFNNGYYEMLKNNQGELYNKVYRDVFQHEFKQVEGYVGFYHLNENDYTEEDYFRRLVDMVKEIQGRGFYGSDIAILARNNRFLGQAAEALMDAGLDVVSADSLRLENSTEVLAVIHFLEYHFNGDKIAARALIYALQDLRIITAEEAGQWAGLPSAELARAVFAGRRRSFYHRLLDSGDAASIIDMLADGFGLYHTAFVYIHKLMDLESEVAVNQGYGVAEFLEYWNRKGRKQTVDMPENKQSVNLYTIHKSKGLQFPVVIYLHKKNKTSSNDDYFVSWQDEVEGVKTGPLLIKATAAGTTDTVFEEDYLREKERKTVDEINADYVATTRPQLELHILSSVTDSKKGINNYIKQYVSTGGWPQQEDGSFYRGEKTVISPRKETAESSRLQAGGYGFTPWSSRFSLKNQLGFSAGRAAKAGEGDRIHQLLAWIEDASEVENALQQGLRQGLLREDEVDDIRNMLLGIVHSKDLEAYFTGALQVMNEKPLLAADGKVLRPDRVVIKDRRVVVIDYKLSDREKASPETVSKYYLQVRSYADALSDIYPEARVKGLIAWLSGDIVVEEV